MRSFHTLVPLCAALVLVGCGGGADPDAAADTAADTSDPAGAGDRATAQAVGVPGAVRLASSDAAGRPGELGGAPCGVSRDGNLVAMVSSSSNLVAGDSNNEADIFLKNLQTGAISRVNTTATGQQMRSGAFLACHAMTPDGTWVVFRSATGAGGSPYVPGPAPEVALLAKNTRTGALLRVTPPLQSVPNTAGYTFHSVTDSGSHVAFTAQPTNRYVGPYSYVANGPARLMVYERAGGSVRDLSTVARLDVGGLPQASPNTAALSPDGDRIAFTSRVDHPEAGDSNGKSDVFVLDLESDNLVLASTDADGTQSVFDGGFQSPPHTVYRFTADGRELLYYPQHDSSIGPAGVYAKDLVQQGLRPLLVDVPGVDLYSPLSFDESASKALLVRRSALGYDIAYLRDLASGAEQRVDTTAAGVVGNGRYARGVLSAAGDQVAFTTDANNLVSLPRRTLRVQAYAKGFGGGASQ